MQRKYGRYFLHTPPTFTLEPEAGFVAPLSLMPGKDLPFPWDRSIGS